MHVRRDIPGFVGNRLQHAMKREAIALVAAGVCDAETIDTIVREGFGARTAVLGPMEQSDLVGLDLALDIAEVLYSDLDRTAGPHPFLREKVKAGKLGMKTGEGFRTWTANEADAVRSRLSRFLAEQAKARNKARTRRGSKVRRVWTSGRRSTALRIHTQFIPLEPTPVAQQSTRNFRRGPVLDPAISGVEDIRSKPRLPGWSRPRRAVNAAIFPRRPSETKPTKCGTNKV